MRSLYITIIVTLLTFSISKGQQSIDFEQLNLGDVFNPPSFSPGDLIGSEDGIPIILSHYQDENGMDIFRNIQVKSAEANDFDYAEKNYLFMGGGISLDFTQASSQVKSVYFIYKQSQDLIRNLTINGEQKSFQSFDSFQGDWGNNVDYSHSYLINQGQGIVTLTGDINQLIISGEALEIDKVSFNTEDNVVVYPGDSNNDGICNYLDVMLIGVGHGKAGPLRSDDGLDWSGQSGILWGNDTSPNLAFSDTDGDGVIDTNDFFLLRDEHIGKMHNSPGIKAPDYFEGNNTDDFTIFFNDSSDGDDTIHYESPGLGEPGYDFNLDLFLIPGNTQDSIYGVSWIWDFNPLIINTKPTAFSFNLNSEFGDESNLISFLDTTRLSEGIIGCSLVRTTGSNTQITNTVALGTFNGIIVDLKGFASSDDDIIDVDSIRGIDFLGEPIEVYDPNIPVFFVQVTGLNENPFSNQSLILFPNPAKGAINALIKEDVINAISEMNIYNIDGKLVYSNEEIKSQMTVSTSSWSSGEYFVELSFKEYQSLIYKVIIQP